MKRQLTTKEKIAIDLINNLSKEQKEDI